MPLGNEYSMGQARAPVGPKQFATIFIKPGHRLFQLGFAADFQDAPLEAITGLLKERKVRVLASSYVRMAGNGGPWDVFLDFEDDSVTAEELGRILKGSPVLKGLQVVGGGETIVDELYFPIVSTSAERFMFMTQEAIGRMLAAMSEQFGTGGDLILYQEGTAMGSRVGGALRATIGGDLRHFILTAVKMYSAMGIARCVVESAEFDPPAFLFRMYDSIECQGRRAAKPASVWIRGHLCGAASVAVQTPMQCTETKCIAAGDPYCEFELTKADH